MMIPGRPAISPVTMKAAGEPLANRPESMPPMLREQLDEISRWAWDNHADAQRNERRFWAIKIIAAICSATAGLFAATEFPVIGTLLGIIGGVIILVDARYPAGRLRGAQMRAYHDLSRLHNTVINKWNDLTLKQPDADKRTDGIRDILEYARKERTRIGNLLKTEESWTGEAAE